MFKTQRTRFMLMYHCCTEYCGLQKDEFLRVQRRRNANETHACMQRCRKNSSFSPLLFFALFVVNHGIQGAKCDVSQISCRFSFRLGIVWG